jgi:hypothetical protein
MKTEKTTDERLASLEQLELLTHDAFVALAEMMLHPKYKAGSWTPTLLKAFAYVGIDATCGDCESGRCHWGGAQSACNVAAVEANPDFDDPCGCARHEVSVDYRRLRAQLAARGLKAEL